MFEILISLLSDCSIAKLETVKTTLYLQSAQLKVIRLFSLHKCNRITEELNSIQKICSKKNYHDTVSLSKLQLYVSVFKLSPDRDIDSV